MDEFRRTSENKQFPNDFTGKLDKNGNDGRMCFLTICFFGDYKRPFNCLFWTQISVIPMSALTVRIALNMIVLDRGKKISVASH
jgi:hypothetical protein